MLPLRFREAGKQRAEREPIDIAGVDACQQRLGEIPGRLLAEAAGHECANRLIVTVCSRRNEELRAHAGFAAPREQAAAQKRPGPRGNAEH